MTSLFSPPKPTPAPLPPAPFVDPVQQRLRSQEAENQALAAAGGGKASTILTSPLGDSNSSSATKRLLGQ